MSAKKELIRGACAPPKPSKAYVEGWDRVFGKKYPSCREDCTAKEPHPCPYLEEIRSDSETLCTCCDACTHECARDV